MGNAVGSEAKRALQELLRAAQALVGEFPLSDESFSAGSVAAALKTRNGHVHTGICMDLACGIGFCAEHAAVAEMLKGRETEIEMIVAVSARKILAPCGRCRELIVQVDRANFETLVGLPGERLVPMRELLPEHWIG